MTTPDPSQREPYCGNCGYVLTGATDSARCPECGRPLVEVLMRPVFTPKGGTRWSSRARLFGLPVVSVAFGPHGEEREGHARGFIAIGSRATGVVAVGGQARGVVAIGGFAMGGFTFGGLSLGLVSSVGGMSVGGLATGGWAIGALAQGGAAVGYVAQGGMVLGRLARGGWVMGAEVIGPGAGSSPAAREAFDALSWFFGGGGLSAGSFAVTFLTALVPLAAAAFVAAVLALLALGRGAGGAAR
jgi:hypothetical protein